MDRKEFAEKYKQEVVPINIQKQRQPRNMQNQIMYTAPIGTAHRAKQSKRKINLKLAALIMAAAIGVGGMALANNSKSDELTPVTITQMQERGLELGNTGLSEETAELLEQYNEYFEKFNSKNTHNLTDNFVINMIDDIEDLHFSVVKEKMGNLLGEDAKNITMYYGTDRGDGAKYATVIINENRYNQKIYNNISGVILGKEQIPDEVADVIRQLGKLSPIEKKLKADEITKVEAIEDLEKIYRKLELIATGTFKLNKKGEVIIKYPVIKEKAEADKISKNGVGRTDMIKDEGYGIE